MYDETVSWFPATKSKSAKLVLKIERKKKIFLSLIINSTFQQQQEEPKIK